MVARRRSAGGAAGGSRENFSRPDATEPSDRPQGLSNKGLGGSGKIRGWTVFVQPIVVGWGQKD
jgi:hypothetical protein